MTGTRTTSSLSEAPSGPGAVLVAENTETGRALADLLRQEGMDVVLCRTGMQAIDSVRVQTWDALVVGFRLLDMRGDAVVFAARATRPNVADRMLLLTTDHVGVEAAVAVRCASLPTDTPVDAIAARVHQLIAGVSAIP